MKSYKIFFLLLVLVQYAQAQQSTDTPKHVIDTLRLKVDTLPKVVMDTMPKPFVPVYDSLLNKIKASSEKASIIINVALDSSYKSYLVEIDGNNNYHLEGVAPFAISMLNDTLYFIHNRKYIYNEYITDTLYYDDGKIDTTDEILFTHRYEFPFITRNIKALTSQITRDKNYQPARLEERPRNWDEEEKIVIRYSLPKFIQTDYSYHGYTGGAHPNWFNSSSLLDKYDFFTQHYSMDDLMNNLDSMKYDMSSYMPVKEMDSIKRVLYFKGVDGYFDDHIDQNKDLTAYDVHRHDKEKLPALTEKKLVDSGAVNYEEINYLINRSTGCFNLTAQAFAFAPYAESGDFSYTASCDAGKLDKRTDPYLSPVKMEDFVSIDRNVFDVFASEKYGSLVLQRLTEAEKDGKTVTENTMRIISLSKPSKHFDLPVNEAKSFISVEWLNEKQYANLLDQLKDCKYFEAK